MTEVIIVTKKGFMKRIPLDWVRVMGRTAKGLRILKLHDNDEVVSAILRKGVIEEIKKEKDSAPAEIAEITNSPSPQTDTEESSHGIEKTRDN